MDLIVLVISGKNKKKKDSDVNATAVGEFFVWRIEISIEKLLLILKAFVVFHSGNVVYLTVLIVELSYNTGFIHK